MTKKTRAKVIISGKVQGVFFRFETKRAAEKYGVTGWVRNNINSTVEAVFEGNKDNVDAAIRWCLKGSASSEVKNVDVIRKEYKNEFNEFKISY